MNNLVSKVQRLCVGRVHSNHMVDSDCYSAQNCLECVLQNNIAMITSIFPHGDQWSAAFRLLARLLMINNTAQMYLSMCNDCKYIPIWL